MKSRVRLHILNSIYAQKEKEKEKGIEFNTIINVHNFFEPVTQTTLMLLELQQSHITIIYTWLSHIQYYIAKLQQYISYLAIVLHHRATSPT
jgi:hypothetical protein